MYVRHQPNRASGGQSLRIEVEDFLSEGHGPQHEALLRLLGKTEVIGTSTGPDRGVDRTGLPMRRRPWHPSDKETWLARIRSGHIRPHPTCSRNSSFAPRITATACFPA
jgi:hypothetical protein